jgi:CheY-like chemotaxis protein
MANKLDKKYLKKILWIEDDADIIDTLVDPLRRDGHSFKIAYTPTEAFRLLSKTKYDLILLDLMLPEDPWLSQFQTELEVVGNRTYAPGVVLMGKYMKTINASTPTIICTVATQGSIDIPYRHIDFLTKPIKPTMFREEVYSAIGLEDHI